jgi:tartrate-resistant acid phosphatase type 5
MKKIILLLVLIVFIPVISNSQNVKFAAIGDYGKSGSKELAVSNLVKSWNPEFIITLGDNNYDLGEQSTIDLNIGQYYHEFISPYFGSYGQGDTINRFFPALGNHDWYTSGAAAYLAYFTLPGNERYYDFIKGDIHFFVIDSDTNEPDGIDSNSVQALWLKNQLALSSQKWNVIYFHHSPYCSSSVHGSLITTQWPFKSWGATTVLTGHDHVYERLTINNFTYFVNGLGGNPTLYSFGTPIAGSQIRYNANNGAMFINSYNDSLVFKFYDITGTLIDNYKILPAEKSLHLTACIQGFYNPNTNSSVGDTVRVYLRNYYPPYSIADSAKSFLDFSGEGEFNFSKAFNATDYYLVINHRNSVETWSASGERFAANVLNYSFTSSSNQAYGNNMIQVDSVPVRFAIYSGDVNRDGWIDLSDGQIVDNNAKNFLSGYVNSDLNGDNITDLTDLAIADNNVLNFIGKITP